MEARASTLPGFAGFPLREALDHTGLGVLTADAHGRITLVSPALRELFGAPPGDLHLEIADPRPGLGPVHVDGSPMAPEQTPLGRAMRGEFVKDVVLGAHDASGRLVWIECNAIPLFEADGTPAGGAVLMHDVTARQAAAVVREELRDRLVHAVNHEFRTPLAALLGNLEVVRDHHDVSAGLAEALTGMERAAWQLCHLVGTVATLIEEQEELELSGFPEEHDGEPVSA